MARPAKGQLIWRNDGWHGRYYATVDGERIRVRRKLGTDNKAVARRKLKRLVEAESVPAEPGQTETLLEACEHVHKQRGLDGVKSADDEAGSRQGRDHPRQSGSGLLQSAGAEQADGPAPEAGSAERVRGAEAGGHDQGQPGG